MFQGGAGRGLTVASCSPMRDGLTLIHLSDLHFGHGAEASTRFEQDLVTSALLEDAVRSLERVGAPDWVLVTGDVAFSAQPGEYARAREWLSALAERLGLPAQRVLLVPGNHDVDRRKAVEKLSGRRLHETLRAKPSEIDHYIADPQELSLLWPKLSAFAEFAQGYGTPQLTPQSPFFQVEAESGLGQVIFVGLNTALLSFDGGDSPLNLALGAGQRARALGSANPGALWVVLQHHPPSWLQDGPKLEAQLQGRPHLLFTGHLHHQQGMVKQPAGEHGIVEFSAGAGHGEAGEEASHAYAWIRLDREGLRFFPRVWAPTRHGFVADRNRFTLAQDESFHVLTEKLPEPLRRWLGRGEDVGEEAGVSSAGWVPAGEAAVSVPESPVAGETVESPAVAPVRLEPKVPGSPQGQRPAAVAARTWRGALHLREVIPGAILLVACVWLAIRSMGLAPPQGSPDAGISPVETRTLEWADTQRRLGLTLMQQGLRERGEKGALFLTSSVEAFQQALTVYNRMTQPQPWAQVESLLGDAQMARAGVLDGVRAAEAFREAEVAYSHALKVYSLETSADAWVAAQKGRGLSLKEQGVRASKADGLLLLAKAVAAYREALKGLTAAAHPEPWADTQRRLGDALSEEGSRLEGQEGSRLLAEAAEAYRQALRVLDSPGVASAAPASLPAERGATLNALGVALKAQGLRVEPAKAQPLLEDAVAMHQKALKVYSRDAHPVPWADTQRNLADALTAQSAHVPAVAASKLLDSAADAYQQALVVYSREGEGRGEAEVQAGLATIRQEKLKTPVRNRPVKSSPGRSR